jgi:tRNA-specific 2-thiouridylase
MIEDCNWLQGSPAQLADEEELEIEVKLRSVSKPYKAYLSAVDIKSKRAVIRLEAPQYGISPGQAAVCYDGDRVLGGGWIYGTENTKFFTGPVSHEAAE